MLAQKQYRSKVVTIFNSDRAEQRTVQINRNFLKVLWVVVTFYVIAYRRRDTSLLFQLVVEHKVY